MSATKEFIARLTRLKEGELDLLRRCSGRGLDDSTEGFDLFTGIWWPLREKNQRAPRRIVAWLIAKLYASAPVRQSPGDTLARQIARCRPVREPAGRRFDRRFDRLLCLGLCDLELPLSWALRTIRAKDLTLDWVYLTDDLSIWEREDVRLRWAIQFTKTKEGKTCRFRFT